jgi:DnaJ like chaperone protein
VAVHFRQAAEASREQPRRESAYTQTTSDDLAHAYRVLQIEPTASDEEVNLAWRRLQRKFHPDRAARDPEEFDRLSRQCVEINRARDIIRSYRRHAQGRAAAG